MFCRHRLQSSWAPSEEGGEAADDLRVDAAERVSLLPGPRAASRRRARGHRRVLRVEPPQGLRLAHPLPAGGPGGWGGEATVRRAGRSRGWALPTGSAGARGGEARDVGGRAWRGRVLHLESMWIRVSWLSFVEPVSHSGNIFSGVFLHTRSRVLVWTGSGRSSSRKSLGCGSSGSFEGRQTLERTRENVCFGVSQVFVNLDLKNHYLLLWR